MSQPFEACVALPVQDFGISTVMLLQVKDSVTSRSKRKLRQFHGLHKRPLLAN